MSPNHPVADVVALVLATLLVAPSLLGFAVACPALRVILGGYAPGPWRWASLPFAVAGALTGIAVAASPTPATLGLLCLGAALALGVVQIATRIVSVRTRPPSVRSVMRRA